jgi:hypothetical protein
MKRRIYACFWVCLLSVAIASAQDIKPDSTVKNRTDKNALRFAITGERLFPFLGAKHWFSNAFAMSGHFMGAYRRIEERAGNDLVSVRDVAMYGGIYAQAEYHWLRGSAVFGQDISPYLAAGIGAGIAETSSWFIAGSIILGAEIFLTPSISLAVEQGVDISYEKYTVFYPTEPFLSLLPFSKGGNSKLLLHIYF